MAESLDKSTRFDRLEIRLVCSDYTVNRLELTQEGGPCSVIHDRRFKQRKPDPAGDPKLN